MGKQFSILSIDNNIEFFVLRTLSYEKREEDIREEDSSKKDRESKKAETDQLA